MRTPGAVAEPRLRGNDVGERTCSVEGCDNGSWARGWCGRHYRRWQRTGDTTLAPPKIPSLCAVAGCTETVSKKVWCNAHYLRFRRHGDPLAGGPSPQTGDKYARLWARVDKSGPVPARQPHLGPCWIWLGSKNKNGYGQVEVTQDGGKKPHLAHRLAYEDLNGPIREGLELDHLCVNPSCVRPSHLESVTHYVNNMRSDSPAAQYARRTHCQRGHELSGENLHLVNGITRRCRACQRIRDRRRRNT